MGVDGETMLMNDVDRIDWVEQLIGCGLFPLMSVTVLEVATPRSEPPDPEPPDPEPPGPKPWS